MRPERQGDAETITSPILVEQFDGTTESKILPCGEILQGKDLGGTTLVCTGETVELGSRSNAWLPGRGHVYTGILDPEEQAIVEGVFQRAESREIIGVTDNVPMCTQRQYELFRKETGKPPVPVFSAQCREFRPSVRMFGTQNDSFDVAVNALLTETRKTLLRDMFECGRSSGELQEMWLQATSVESFQNDLATAMDDEPKVTFALNAEVGVWEDEHEEPQDVDGMTDMERARMRGKAVQAPCKKRATTGHKGLNDGQFGFYADLTDDLICSYRGNRRLWVAVSMEETTKARKFCLRGIRRKTDEQLIVGLGKTLKLLNRAGLAWMMHFDKERGIERSEAFEVEVEKRNGEVKHGIPGRHNSNAVPEQCVRESKEDVSVVLEGSCIDERHWDTVSEGVECERNYNAVPPMAPLYNIVQDVPAVGELGWVVLADAKLKRKGLDTRASPCCFIGRDISTSAGIWIEYLDRKVNKIRITTVHYKSCKEWTKVQAYSWQRQGLRLLSVSNPEFGDAEIEDEVQCWWATCDECEQWRRTDMQSIAIADKRVKWKCSDIDRHCESSEDELDEEEQLIGRVNVSRPAPIISAGEREPTGARKPQVEMARGQEERVAPKPSEKKEDSGLVKTWLVALGKVVKSEAAAPIYCLTARNRSELVFKLSGLGAAVPGSESHLRDSAATICVTRPVKKSEMKGLFAHLDWEAAVRKEVDVMMDHDVFGRPLEYEDAKRIPGAVFARLLEVFVIKDYDLGPDAWQARCRIVLGGHAMWDASGKPPTLPSMFAVPAGLKEVRVLIACGLIRGWDVRQFDVSGAYLHAKLNEPTFVKVTEALGLVLNKVMTAGHSSSGMRSPVWTLEKALYGHPLASFLWDEHFSSVLVEISSTRVDDVSMSFWIGYTESKAGSGDWRACVVLVIYVDDGVIAGTSRDIRKFMARVAALVKIKEVTELGKMLGVSYIVRASPTRDEIRVALDMRPYMRLACDRVRTDAGHLQKVGGRGLVPATDPVRTLEEQPVGTLKDGAPRYVGTFLYGVRCGFPAESFAVGVIARHVSKWTTEQDEALMRLVRFFEKHDNDVLVWTIRRKDFEMRTLKLVAWVDADHAGERETRHSTSGVMIAIVGEHGTFVLLDWMSKKQTAVACSTGEAELAAIFHGGKEVLVLAAMIEVALGFSIPISILSDSTCALDAVRAGFSARMRYANKTHGLSLSWIKENLGEFLAKVLTTFNAADVGTKALEVIAYHLHRRFIGMMNFDEFNRTDYPCACQLCVFQVFGKFACRERVDRAGGVCVKCQGATGGCVCRCWYGD